MVPFPNTTHMSTNHLDLSINDTQVELQHNSTLVGHLITQKPINTKVMVAVLQSSWNLGKNVTFSVVNKSMVACTFSNKDDMKCIRSTGPWSVKGATLNLKPWPADIPVSEIDFKECDFWVQIHNLPPNRMNESNVVKLGNHIGRFIKVEENPPRHVVRDYIRILVALDVEKAIKPGCYISREEGNQHWVTYKYERLADFCYKCGKLDHTDRACVLEIQDEEVTKDPVTEYGTWMRTPAMQNKKRQSPVGKENHTEDAEARKRLLAPNAIRTQVLGTPLKPKVLSQSPISFHDDNFQSDTPKVKQPLLDITNHEPTSPDSYNNLHSSSHFVEPPIPVTHYCDASLKPTLEAQTLSSIPTQNQPTLMDLSCDLIINPLGLRQSSVPFTHIPSLAIKNSQCTQPFLKRKCSNVPTIVKKSRVIDKEMVNISFAKLHIQAEEVKEAMEEVVEEERVTTVRRRFIHIKSQARNRHRDTVSLGDENASVFITNVPEDYTAEEAGSSMPPTVK